MQYFSSLFIGLIVIDLMLKLYLNYRQISSINKNYNQVPQPFDKTITLTDHQKSANYSQAKLYLANVELFIATGLTILFTIGGGIEFVAKTATIVNYHISSEVLLVITYAIITLIVHIPLGYIKIFKIEQKFGFNNMTIKTFVADQIKSLVLLLAIGLPLLYLIFWLMDNLSDGWWLWVWLVLVVFNLLAMIIYPLFIAPLFNKFTKLEDELLNQKIEALLTQCGFKSQGVFVMDGSKRSSHGNAYFTGIGNSKRIVFFDTLLKQLNHQQIIAVLAHELGHFKHKHILKQMLVSFAITLFGLYIYSLLIGYEWFYHALNVQTINYSTGLLLLLIFTNLISLPLAPISSFMSRKNEYEADDFARMHANKQDLIDGLVNMYRDNASTLTPDAWYVTFYYSHPPASLRIANLEK